MQDTAKSTTPQGYQINNTVYQVKSVFCAAPKAERLEDKIERLILKDNSGETAPT